MIAASARDDAAVASPAAVAVLGALLHARTGQQLAAARNWRIDTALRPLMAEYRVETADQIVTLVLDGRDPGVAARVVDVLLNQETSFFRDAGMLDAAIDALAPEASDASRSTRRVRIWSAGCATGQEPLSLAMLFAERGVAPEIIATDVSDTALARARSGRYTQFEIQRGLPMRRMVRWFDGGYGEDWVAKSELVARIAYRRHNLVVDHAPAGAFDMVLCRNVLFYLDTDLRTRVLERIAGALKPGGWLMLGAGETVIGQSDRFRPCRTHRSLYELVPAEAALGRA